MSAPAAPANNQTRAASAPPGILNRARGSISRARIEKVMSRTAGIFGIVFALQALPGLLASGDYLSPAWAIAMPVVLFVGMLAVLITSIIARGVVVAAGVVATAFVLSLVLWPAAVVHPNEVAPTQPWLWYLVTVATAYAAIAFNVWLAGLYVVVVPIMYAILRALPSGGGAGAGLAALDALYVFILGAFILILLTTLRNAADRVDQAQQAAMLRYSVAVKQDAMEAERLHVDALVHDRVLTTLLSASKSNSAMERDLVVEMAQDALRALHSSGEPGKPGFETTLGELAERLANAARVLSPGFDYAHGSIPQRTVPGDVAEAVFSAAVQAMVNSLQHADDPAVDKVTIERTLSVHADKGEGFTVQVSDTGVGFDPAQVPQERLGLRVSIRERVATVGGAVQIQSVPGGGASIVIVWPDPNGETTAEHIRRVFDPGEQAS
ncbi:Signal transduction histidine kinase [Agreia bicolorata]|uniref:Signal transduction histidine kinase n=1 Tax=Agreia bicolorata TaxID=110935 RepID=A0A1T4XW04_9MICO|nr:ATP-binding protein [Agreia bicolorata]SKA93694.1 Signal transduction histidine kinase [Agreia bicolorata]